MTRTHKLRIALMAAFAALLLVGAAPSHGSVRNYNLGDTTLPDASPMGPLPVRLWGAIGVPDGPGRFPLVIVAHGRHGDNCPHTQSFVFTWPCFAREQRNDLGLRHIVAALADRGIAAVAPDLNASYTIGWGDEDNLDEARWPKIVNRTMSLIAASDEDDSGHPFGLDLERRLDLKRIGLLGHSRSGFNAVRFARSRAANTSPGKVAAGQGPVGSLFLLAPVYGGVALPDIKTTVVLSECDGDVHGQGLKYFEGAATQRGRRSDVFLLRLGRANHNYYNSTLSDLGVDDGRFGGGQHCRDGERLKPKAQQGWIDKVTTAFFNTTLRRAKAPSWMRPLRAPLTTLYGLGAGEQQFFPSLD